MHFAVNHWRVLASIAVLVGIASPMIPAKWFVSYASEHCEGACPMQKGQRVTTIKQYGDIPAGAIGVVTKVGNNKCVKYPAAYVVDLGEWGDGWCMRTDEIRALDY